MVGSVPGFQPGGPGSIPGGVRIFNFYPGIGCVSFVLYFVVSGGGPDIHPFTIADSVYGSTFFHSNRRLSSCIWLVFWSIVCAPLTGIRPMDIWVASPGGVNRTLGGGKYLPKKERKRSF